jgi:hypothetical protein
MSGQVLGVDHVLGVEIIPTSAAASDGPHCPGQMDWALSPFSRRKRSKVEIRARALPAVSTLGTTFLHIPNVTSAARTNICSSRGGNHRTLRYDLCDDLLFRPRPEFRKREATLLIPQCSGTDPRLSLKIGGWTQSSFKHFQPRLESGPGRGTGVSRAGAGAEHDRGFLLEKMHAVSRYSKSRRRACLIDKLHHPDQRMSRNPAPLPSREMDLDLLGVYSEDGHPLSPQLPYSRFLTKTGNAFSEMDENFSPLALFGLYRRFPRSRNCHTRSTL